MTTPGDEEELPQPMENKTDDVQAFLRSQQLVSPEHNIPVGGQVCVCGWALEGVESFWPAFEQHLLKTKIEE